MMARGLRWIVVFIALCAGVFLSPNCGIRANAQSQARPEPAYARVEHALPIANPYYSPGPVRRSWNHTPPPNPNTSATLRVFDYNRILLNGLTAVREEYGWKVDLEESPYEGMPRKGAFVSTYPETPDIYASNSSEETVLNKIVSDYNQAGFPGNYKVIAQADGGYAVVGTAKQKADGTSEAMTPILDTPISIPNGMRGFWDELNLITKALSTAIGREVDPQFAPMSVGISNAPVVGVSGDNVPARTFLQQVLPRGMVWYLSYNYEKIVTH
jgi:hypothetical protein